MMRAMPDELRPTRRDRLPGRRQVPRVSQHGGGTFLRRDEIVVITPADNQDGS